MTTSPYITAKAAQERLKMSRQRLHGLLETGEIVGVHTRGGWLISRASVEEFAQKFGVDAPEG